MSIAKERILFEDAHLLAVHKLSGELVVKGKGPVGKLPLLDFLKKEYPGLRPLHRLDFETSGVVVFARTKQCYEAVVPGDFAGWKKVYRTLVMGRMHRMDGEIRAPLPARTRGTVPALTRYAVLERFANSSYVEAEIETGRHHQIRRHFAGIGHPLALDEVYGQRAFNRLFTREFGYRKFFLHALRITFPHPVTGGRVSVETPLPRAFEEVLSRLRSL